MRRTAREPPAPKPTYGEFSIALLYQARRDMLGMQIEEMHARRLYADANAARAYYEIWIPVRITTRRKSVDRRAGVRRFVEIGQAVFAFCALSLVSTVIVSIAVLGVMNESSKASLAAAQSDPANPFKTAGPRPHGIDGQICDGQGATEIADDGNTYICGKGGMDGAGHLHWNA